ncbi:MAG: phosphoglucomutase/phosphomannomutase family protein [Candidatus Korobacteraceae bacterium]|jgi:phosphomannomutase
MASAIKFGTDGWRAIIADDFIFENVRRVSRAIANYIHRHEDPAKGVLLAYDTRFGSRRFAEVAAEQLADAGLQVRLANDYTPTPALSYAVKQMGAAGGVMITSSHNPWSWNGVKFKASYGGSATPEIMRKIEGYLDAPATPAKGGRVSEIDFKAPYVAAIEKFADIGLISKAGFRFAIDVMYGAGRGVLAGIFHKAGVPYLEIRGEVNPLFPGINPEPILPHVKALQDTVVREKCSAGLAVDGDADRIGAVAEDGSFVDSHKCFAVLLEWLLKRKQWPGAVTRAFNTTSMLDRIARKYHRELIEHGIGFKYVCDIVLSGREVLVGGEESGGIGIPRHLPERDGILNCLLLANVMAEEGKSLGQLVEQLQNEYGRHYYGRRDLHIADELKLSALCRAAERPRKIGYKVLRMEDMDGYKFFLDAPSNGDGAEPWVLLRGSGTEPLLRIYCEASSPELVEEILSAAESFVYCKATVA